MPYGYELVLDLHGCNVARFTRASIATYFRKLCDAIDMVRCEMYFWDDEGVPPEERQTSPHTDGISAIQFILTSNITVHALTQLEAVYVNIFSCKPFDHDVAKRITTEWFEATTVNETRLERR